MILPFSVGGPDGGVPGLIEVMPPLLHQFFQLRGVGLVHQLPFGGTVQRNDAVPVRHSGNMAGGGADGFAHGGCKFLQIPHGGVFTEDHPAVLLGVNLQRVTFPDAEGPADFFGNDDTTEVV